MNTLEKVKELASRLHAEPSNTRIRIQKLFDENSFIELGSFNEDAGVIIGYGTINDKLVYAYSQSSAVNVKHAKKIAQIYEQALKMGAPVIGIMDSKGLVIEDGIDNFEAYGIMFTNQVNASGVVPQMSIILGDCLGTAAFTPVLSDFVFMTSDKARLFMSSPLTFKGLEGKSTSYDMLGSGKNHSQKTGMVHCCYENEQICIEEARKLISLLPSNNMDISVSASTDNLNREDIKLNTIVPDDSSLDIDIKFIINSIADDNYFFEIQKDFAQNIICGFIKLGGITTGIVANNGLLNINAVQKAAEFINFCDAFNISILSLTDVYGYEKNVEQEQKGIMRHSAKLMYSFAQATVPKVNVIIRNAIGNPYLLMNSKHIGADIVYAWPTAEISLLDKKSSVNLLKINPDEYDENSSAYAVSKKGYIDGIIIPAATRKRVLVAMEMLSTKRKTNPAKKHSSI